MLVAITKLTVKGWVMEIDISQLTNGEIEDMEEYCGRPVMGLLNRALQEATEERVVKGKDSKGRPLEETVYDIDPNIMLDFLPTKVVAAMNCVTKRRKDPSFTMDKWRDARFGDDGSEQSAPNPRPRSTSRRKPSGRRSNVNSPNSEKNDSTSTPPSATSTPVIPLSSARSSRKRNSARSSNTTTTSTSPSQEDDQ